MIRLILSLLLIPSLLLVSTAAEPKKYALVIGVSEYEKEGFPNLRYADRDANELAAELKKQDFAVLTVIGKLATKEKVEQELDRFLAATRRLGKQDIVMIYFAGHGVQMTVPVIRAGGQKEKVESPFLCVRDSLKSDPATMVSLNRVIEGLNAQSGCRHNLLLVDACRNNPNRGARTLDGGTVTRLPPKISILFSGSPGQLSYESEKVRHGVFTHALLEGLRGEAKNARDEVSWLFLASYVATEVPILASELLEDDDLRQQPNLINNSFGSPILGRVSKDSSPDMVKPVRPPTNPTQRPPLLVAPFGATEISASRAAWSKFLGRPERFTNGIGMEFVLVPPGTYTMGSPESEEGHSDREQAHRVTISEPFYVSIHEVTQKQYESLTGQNPSGFSRSGRYADRVTGEDTSLFPVESVSWEDASKFCGMLTSRFGSDGRYALPREAEWEYFCRAGTTSVFHFGDRLAGDFANHDGNYPYGTSTKGRDLGRPTRVGSYGANGFGLFDLHGNVWEWCQDWYDGDYYSQSMSTNPSGPSSGSSRVLRGGSWFSHASYCRSACRDYVLPDSRGSRGGFRVVLRVR